MKHNITKNLIKGSILIGGTYLAADVIYQMGKGYMLGILIKYNIDADYMYKILHEDRPFNLNRTIINFMTDATIDDESEES